MIRGAAAGLAQDREKFAHRYEAVVRTYLGARWRQSPLTAEIDDATQEVFVACFQDRGVLARADAERPGGFRPFFYGVVRNIARRFETGRATRKETQPTSSFLDGGAAVGDNGFAEVFDRAWVLALLKQAANHHKDLAQALGETGRRRVELLRLRFEEGLPIREIAKRWDLDPAGVHKEYARARDDFKAALLEVVAFHYPGAPPGEVGRECARLLALIK